MATELICVLSLADNTKVGVVTEQSSDEPAALDIEGHVVQRVVCGEGGVPVFEECEADEIIAGDGECSFVARSDANNTALSAQAGGDVEIVVDIESDALRAAESLVKNSRVAVAVDGVDGLIGGGGGAGDEEGADVVKRQMVGSD